MAASTFIILRAMSNYAASQEKTNHSAKCTISKRPNEEVERVNIEGLPKERVLLALFKNVCGKSDFSKKHQHDLLKIDSSFSEMDAHNELLANLYINTIGSVRFDIDFSNNDFINTEKYDLYHQTKSNFEIMSAKDCIQTLRDSLEQEKNINMNQTTNTIVEEEKKKFKISQLFHFSKKHNEHNKQLAHQFLEDKSSTSGSVKEKEFTTSISMS